MSFYAVAKGRIVGIYNTWTECSAQVNGYSGGIYKKFKTKPEAEKFVSTYSTSLPSQNSSSCHTQTSSSLPSQTLSSIPSQTTPSLPLQTTESITSPTSLHNSGILPTDEIIVFTDGSCINNGNAKKAGYACVFPNNPEFTFAGTINENPTNNRAEYTAFISACDQANKLDPDKQKVLRVYTDSNLLVNTATKWLTSWKKKNWKKSDGEPVLNLDLVKEIDKRLEEREIIFSHVKAHTGGSDWIYIWNDKVDKLAKQYAV